MVKTLGVNSRYNDSRGLVPMQENPNTVDQQAGLLWNENVISCISLKESQIVSPSEMFVIADKSP